MSRRVRWFSCGAASAVATMLDLREHGRGGHVVATCKTGSEDDDNDRFMADCVQWWNEPVTVLQNDEDADNWSLWDRRNYMAGISGAICTTERKVLPRLDFQRPDDVHVFGYTADRADVYRADRLRNHYPELTVVTPLIVRGITKAGCLAMIERAGIKPPRTYAMGFPNANCLKSGCVKATSPNYWALHRKHYPEGFARTAGIARRLGVRLARINDERVFVDDIPPDWPTLNPLAPSCDFLCHLAEQDIAPDGPTPSPHREDTRHD